MLVKFLGVVTSISLAVIYVFFLYLFSDATKSRNDISVIKQRTMAAFAASFVSLVLTYYWTTNFLVETGILQNIFGYIFTIFWSVFLTACFFLGSVYMMCEQSGFFKNQHVFVEFLIENLKWIKHLILETWSYTDYITVRALMVGPITEEIVYRSCMIACLLGSGWDHYNSVLISSFLFGISHSHHLFEHVVHGNHPLVQALITILVQLCYTTLFATYCGYIFVSTGSLMSCILIHSWCNHFSLPDIQAIKEHQSRSKVIGIYVMGIVIFAILVKYT